jgi:hypothetical protein
MWLTPFARMTKLGSGSIANIENPKPRRKISYSARLRDDETPTSSQPAQLNRLHV